MVLRFGSGHLFLRFVCGAEGDLEIEVGDLGSILGGALGDLVSKVISTLIGVISNYRYSYLIYNPSY